MVCHLNVFHYTMKHHIWVPKNLHSGCRNAAHNSPVAFQVLIGKFFNHIISLFASIIAIYFAYVVERETLFYNLYIHLIVVPSIENT